jgi:hypothetical protein
MTTFNVKYGGKIHETTHGGFHLGFLRLAYQSAFPGILFGSSTCRVAALGIISINEPKYDDPNTIATSANARSGDEVLILPS